MSAVWLVVLVVGIATIAFKATGPVLLGDRELPEPVARVVALLAPVLLSALVVTQTVGGDNELVLDARLAGVGAGAVAIAARAPLPAVVVIAALATALDAARRLSSSCRRRTFRDIDRPEPRARKSRVLRGGIASMRAKKGARWGSHACFRDRETGPKPPRGRRWGA